MPLDIYQRGSTWHYRGTVAGRRLRGSCKTTDKTKAARKASQIEERAWKRDTDGPESVLTFAQAAIKYRNAGKSDQFLPAVEDYFKDTLVREITPDVVQEMAMKLWGHATGQSRNRMALKPTQAVINHCAGAKLCQRIRIPRFKEEAKIKTPVDLAWVKAFMAHASPHLGAYALFMYLTGARPSEALAVQWDDLSLNRCTALIRMTKILSEREANLPTLLVTALQQLPRVKGRPVFVYRCYQDVKQSWRAAAERAGIKRLSPHCCRHGFATDLLRKGVDVHTVAWLGGWQDAAQVLKTYGHAIKRADINNLLVEAATVPIGTKLAQRAQQNARKAR